MATEAQQDVVYQRAETKSSSHGGKDREGFPTIEVLDASVDMYVSNNSTAPVDENDMTLDSTLAAGIHVVDGTTRWILFTNGDGATIYCEGII